MGLYGDCERVQRRRQTLRRLVKTMSYVANFAANRTSHEQTETHMIYDNDQRGGIYYTCSISHAIQQMIRKVLLLNWELF